MIRSPRETWCSSARGRFNRGLRDGVGDAVGLAFEDVVGCTDPRLGLHEFCAQETLCCLVAKRMLEVQKAPLGCM
jgi:hypothetical protein